MSVNFGRNKYIIAAAKELARQLRKRQTKSEGILWEVVRNRKFLGLKFFRQHPLFFDFLGAEKFFIADFYCHEQNIVIEVDGKIHDYQKEYDLLRDYMMNSLGIRVLRFTNEEIEFDIKMVLQKIENFINHSNSP